jgi:hypothetical protein
VNPSKPFVLDMDAFDFVFGIMLSQFGKDDFFHLVNFRFCKFFHVEITYEIHDKKLLIIRDVFEEWCHLFERYKMKLLCT